MAIEPKPFPLAVQPDNRGIGATAASKDAKIVNAFLEKNSTTGELVLFKRPGLVNRGSPGTGAYGIYNWEGNVYICANGHLWQVTGGATLSFTDLGIISAADSRRFQFTECGSSGLRHLYFSNDSAAYLMTPAHVISTPAGANFPGGGGSGSSAYLDGTLYVLDIYGNIHGSAVGDPTDWTDTTNVISTLAKNEKAVTIYALNNYIIAFKNYSLDAYWDQGNPTGSPLALIQGAHAEIGIYNAGETLAKVGVELFWLGQTKDGPFQVFKMTNLNVTKISTPPVERLLALCVSQTIRGYSATFNGKKFYVVSSINSINSLANITLAYDVETAMWYQWTWYDGGPFPFDDSAISNIVAADIYSTTRTSSYLLNRTDGEVYYLDPNTYTDDDGQFAVEIVTPNIDGGSRNIKVLGRMDLVGDQITGALVSYRFSDDDYQTWGSWATVDMGLDLDIQTNLGSFRKRAFHFKHQQNTALRLKRLDLYLNPGAT